MQGWVYRVLLPIVCAAFVCVLVIKRRVVARRTGKDPVVIRPVRRADTPHGYIEAVFVVGMVSFGVDIAANALVVDFVERWWAIPALRGQPILGWAGVALLGTGIGLAVAGIVGMGESWKIGIDRGGSLTLVTQGIYSVIRHPIYAGMLILAPGLALATADLLSCAVTVGAWIALPVQARLEEEFLLSREPDAYARYMARTGRFVPGVGHGTRRE